MTNYTPHQSKYFAEQILLKRPPSSYEGLASTMSNVKVDLNPHQVDAALFAMRSPLSSGVLMADEVGLGKTIEAGLVLAQYWAERKRNIILIVPAALRTQWRSELKDKFYIDSILMESTTFNKYKKEGKWNPFNIKNKVIICSYQFASKKSEEIKSVPWDLVIMDEAHRLRNVYKPNNVTGKKLQYALQGRKKLLLTATPLQNNLMELYGLVSIIDDHIFGDAKTFREMYVGINNTEIRNHNLKIRLKGVCQRTLRKQVTEYVKYTQRHAILQEYTPTDDEEKLYNLVSNYLQTDKLYALPEGQRTLITMVLRKLLASSSFAISGTLNSLISRLNSLLDGVESDLNLNDYDLFGELNDERDNVDNSNERTKKELLRERSAIISELEQLKSFSRLATSIQINAKGDNLIFALKQGFKKIEELGGNKKAVIFTESRRTQEYLFNLLSNNGYNGKIVFLNGSNNDEISKKIYTLWKKNHENDGLISGSKQADMKSAVVEEFKNNASILIGTEAASEGINLQFCSLVVNYDLPWNPQRIEQRIGRCHRYGQKNDVVVINFLNKSNAADCRVYELLDEKFKLFQGVFGSSDDVLGSIESGVDFERRIAGIYQNCKTADEIKTEFDQLQDELSEQIEEKMIKARQSILENFDEVVASRLKECQSNTIASLDKFTQWLYYFFLSYGGDRISSVNSGELKVKMEDGIRTYNLSWKNAEKFGQAFLRKDDPICKEWLNIAQLQKLGVAKIRFEYSNSHRHISFIENHLNLQGLLSVDKLSYSGISEEEHIIFSSITNDGTKLDDETINNLLELPAQIIDCNVSTNIKLENICKINISRKEQEIEENNKKYYLDECDKLDAYSEDLKQGLKNDLKELKKAISEKKKDFRANTSLPLSEMLTIKDEINRLERKYKKMQRDIYDKEDEIESENERLQEEIRQKLNGNIKIENIIMIEFEVI